jgi:FkbM family methyltransferase
MNRKAFGLRRALRLVFGSSVLPVRGESGRWFWFRPGEYPSLLRGFSHFEPREVVRWQALLRPDDVVYDIGANIGITAHRIFGLLDGKCTILAFEPVPRNAELLERNAANLGGTTTVMRCAVGDADGSVRIRENRRHGGLSARADIDLAERDVAFWSEQAEFEVPMRCLDSLIRDGARPPDFVKIDVEGAGHYVLRGARDLLQAVRPAWSISLHNETEAAGILAVLGEAGYRGVRFSAPGVTTFCALAEADGGMYVHPDSPKASRVGAREH